jgi:LmbE family N-acetylglucosaminyl deacetylase
MGRLAAVSARILVGSREAVQIETGSVDQHVARVHFITCVRRIAVYKTIDRRRTLLAAACMLLIAVLANSFSANGAESTPATDRGPRREAGGDHLKAADDSLGKLPPLRILVIGAHPADAFDQSGGTMAHHIERGDWVGCAVVTTGVRVHDKVVTDEMQKRKKIPEADHLKKIMAERTPVKEKEVIKALSILGVREQDVVFLGVDDAVLLVNQELVRRVASLIRKLRPDVIITHYPFEDAGLGTAHAITGQIVVHALPLAAGVDPGDTTPPHKVAQMFFFGQGAAAARTNVWSAQGGFYNDVFVDITDVAAKKVACLDAMESQGYGGAYARKRIETSDGGFGEQISTPYAEGFITMKSTTHYYLPVSAMDLRKARMSDHETITGRSYRINVP